MTSPFQIILLKTNDDSASNGNSNDRYVDLLKQTFDQVEHVNLLQFENCHLAELRERVLSFDYKCLIVTSKQAAQVLATAFQHDHQSLQSRLATSSMTVYCVGQATASVFRRSFEHEFEQGGFRIVISDEAKNSNKLAQLVISDYEKQDSGAKYALFPCSSIRMDDLPLELAKAHVPCDELTVYKTTRCEQGCQRLNELLLNNGNKPLALVFFSPSGVEAAFETASLLDCNILCLVSIGPKTTLKIKSYCRDDRFTIYEANEPSPQAVLNTLKTIYDNQLRN